MVGSCSEPGFDGIKPQRISVCVVYAVLLIPLVWQWVRTMQGQVRVQRMWIGIKSTTGASCVSQSQLISELSLHMLKTTTRILASLFWFSLFRAVEFAVYATEAYTEAPFAWLMYSCSFLAYSVFFGVKLHILMAWWRPSAVQSNKFTGRFRRIIFIVLNTVFSTVLIALKCVLGSYRGTDECVRLSVWSLAEKAWLLLASVAMCAGFIIVGRMQWKMLSEHKLIAHGSTESSSFVIERLSAGPGLALVAFASFTLRAVWSAALVACLNMCVAGQQECYHYAQHGYGCNLFTRDTLAPYMFVVEILPVLCLQFLLKRSVTQTLEMCNDAAENLFPARSMSYS